MRGNRERNLSHSSWLRRIPGLHSLATRSNGEVGPQAAGSNIPETALQKPSPVATFAALLGKFPTKVTYKPGKKLLLADALSRFPCKEELSEEAEQFHVSVVSSLPVSDRQQQSIKEATINDASFTDICRYVSTERLERNDHLPDALRPY